MSFLFYVFFVAFFFSYFIIRAFLPGLVREHMPYGGEADGEVMTISRAKLWHNLFAPLTYVLAKHKLAPGKACVLLDKNMCNLMRMLPRVKSETLTLSHLRPSMETSDAENAPAPGTPKKRAKHEGK